MIELSPERKRKEGDAMNSSRKGSNQILGMVSDADARRLLLDWVNTDSFSRDNGVRKRLLLRHPEIFADLDPAIYNEKPFDDPAEVITPERRQLRRLIGQVFSLIANVGTYLQAGWNESDPRRREWLFVKSRLLYHSGLDGLRAAMQGVRMGHSEVREVKDGVEQPPRPVRRLQVDTPDDLHLAFALRLAALEVSLTPFEAAMFHLQTHLTDKIRRCPNQTCPAPYFFAVKRAQKFCSTKCAEPAQREAKRRWWNENRGKN
jgi:hypothetical protein